MGNLQTLMREGESKKPALLICTVKISLSSACLPFSGCTALDPSALKPSLLAVFSVHIAQSMTRAELQEFAAWIHTLINHATGITESTEDPKI